MAQLSGRSITLIGKWRLRVTLFPSNLSILSKITPGQCSLGLSKDLAKRSNLVDWSRSRRKFEHLRDVNFTPLPNPARISVLIGADCHDLMRGLETISGTKPDNPWAFKTPLGWSCLGPIEPRFPGDVTKPEVHSMIIND
jgi:hypothetical protein